MIAVPTFLSSHGFRWQRFAIMSVLSVTTCVSLGLGLSAISSSVDGAEPIMRIDAGGPTSFVTSLVFSPDNQTLYAAGYDKVIRVWRRDAAGRFTAGRSLRVPIGPGQSGVINCLAISSDGRYLAAAGSGLVRGRAGFKAAGRVLPSQGVVDGVMRLDEGTIRVFDLVGNTVIELRGHLGPVQAMQFAPGPLPILVSSADEWDGVNQKRSGGIRIFDVQKGAMIHAGVGLPRTLARPGLSVIRRDNNNPTAILVGVAWGDGAFRLWDPAANKLFPVADGRMENRTAVSDPATQQMLTASFGGQDGRLQAWRVGQGAPLPLPGTVTFAPENGNAFVFPKVLEMVPAKNAAFVIVRRTTPNPNSRIIDWQLRAVSYANGRLGAVLVNLTLDEFGTENRVPVMVASPDGKQLAISGSQDHKVRLFNVADLLGGQLPKPEVLQNVALTPKTATFYKKGQDHGILVQADSPNGQVQNWFFDVTARTIKPVLGQGWNRDTPSTAGWNLGSSLLRGQTPQWEVTAQGPGVNWALRLPPGVELTAKALLPPDPAKPASPAILAVATYSNREGWPSMMLYRVGDSQPFRQLTGHDERIVDISFSGDWHFLVSTGIDQTVRVWNLTDLDTILGKRGMLPGLTVDNRGGKVEVVSVAAGSPLADKLPVGTVLLAARDGQREVKLRTAMDLYDLAWQTAPGRPLLLDGENNFRLAATVVQGTDEQKPLFSLLVNDEEPVAAGAAAVDGLSWVGWRPTGAFDASDGKMQSRLGWHFNTGVPESPVRFGQLNEFPQYQRANLLADLLNNPNSQSGDVQPIARPKMVLYLRELGVVDGPLLRTRQAEVRLAVSLKRRQVKSVRLFADDVFVGEFQNREGQVWAAPLNAGSWKRGDHQLRAVLVTNENLPQQFDTSLLTRFQPLPPSLSVTRGSSWVQNARHQANIDVTPQPGEAARVSLKHWHNGKIVASPPEWQVPAKQRLQHMVQLRPGRNRIELVAINRQAMLGFEHLELERQTYFVDFQPQKPVQVQLKLIHQQQPNLPAEEVLLNPGGQTPLGRGSNRLRVEVQLDQPPQWSLQLVSQATKKVISQPLAFAAAGQLLRAEIAVPAAHAGSHELRIVDQQGKELFAATTVVPLPALRIAQPARNGLPLYEGTHPAEVALQADSDAPLPPADLIAAVEVLSNGIVLTAKPTIAGGTITATVPLAERQNNLQVRLRLKDGSQSLSSPVSVDYLRLPVVSQVKFDLQAKPKVSVTLQGTGSLPLTRLEIGERSFDAADIKFARNGLNWTATVVHPGLPKGMNKLDVYAWTADGRSRNPAEAIVTIAGPAKVAEIVMLHPAVDTALDQPEIKMRYSVRSTTRLQSVEILNGHKVVYTAQPAAQRTENGLFLLDEEVPVALNLRENILQIQAVNDGGLQRSETRTVTYMEPPVPIEIVGISLTKNGPLIEPKRTPQGLTFDQPVGQNLIFLHGRVNWSGLDQNRLQGRSQAVQVFVNTFQQNGVTEVPAANSSKFVAALLLNRKDNKIEVRLSEFANDEKTKFGFQIQCLKPADKQRLHLLIVGVGVPRAAEGGLSERVLKGLRAKRQPNPSEFATATFPEGVIYGPLSGSDLNEGDVFKQLVSIQQTIEQLRNKKVQDIVMLYYEGGIITQDAKGFVLSTRPPNDPITKQILVNPRRFRDYSIDSELLSNFIETTTGAHVLLLDVARQPQAILANNILPANNRAALMRFAYVNPPQANPPGANLPGANRPTLMGVMQQIPQQVSLKRLDDGLKDVAKRKDFLIKYNGVLPPSMVNMILAP